MERALELKRSGRLDQAVIVLEALLADDPRNALALTYLADTQLRRRRPADALAELDKAEAAGGATAFTARVRGDALYRLGRHRDAARAYEEADALGDREAWPMAQLARCRLRDNDVEGARDAAARAVEREPEAAAGWVAQGEVALRAREPALAEERFQRAHELAPNDQYAYARLVEARLLQLEPEERGRELEVLLRSSGRENRFLGAALARLQEGYALRRAGKLDEAAVLLRDVLLEDPADVILFKTYISLQRQRGELGELKQTLQDLLPIAGARKGAVYGELRKLPE